MKNYKSKIIKRHGTKVIVDRFEDGSFTTRETKALLGRASRNNNNMRTLNNQKEGIFLPTFDIRSGDFVSHGTRGEKFVVGGVHPEYDGDRILSHVCNLLLCSHQLTIKGNTRQADNRGNLKTVFGDKYVDIPCHVEEVTDELRQYESGLHPDTEYKVYTALLQDVDLTDQLMLSINSTEEKFKVVSTDYVTFPDMLVLEINRDIRT